jgi:hypothetical protein
VKTGVVSGGNNCWVAFSGLGINLHAVTILTTRWQYNVIEPLNVRLKYEKKLYYSVFIIQYIRKTTV